mmetsp:Transcript_6629/g.10477  ORF Transcript_6629/g.10477 Transcript_6629/m.10477 type:complete len:263 (-) Transcript_6629:308-1096(-)
MERKPPLTRREAAHELVVIPGFCHKQFFYAAGPRPEFAGGDGLDVLQWRWPTLGLGLAVILVGRLRCGGGLVTAGQQNACVTLDIAFREVKNVMKVVLLGARALFAVHWSGRPHCSLRRGVPVPSFPPFFVESRAAVCRLARGGLLAVLTMGRPIGAGLVLMAVLLLEPGNGGLAPSGLLDLGLADSTIAEFLPFHNIGSEPGLPVLKVDACGRLVALKPLVLGGLRCCGWGSSRLDPTGHQGFPILNGFAEVLVQPLLQVL